jgi:uncharacterized surface protein with fasciclin (FAS1) repeats
MNLTKNIAQQKTFLFSQLLPSLMVLLLIAGCAKEFQEPAPPAGGSTVTSIISSSDNFNILSAALNKTGLAATLNNNISGQHTVFAASDDALLTFLRARYSDFTLTEAAAINKINQLTNTSTTLNIGQLTAILEYHIISSEIPSSQITGAQSFNTLANSRLSLSKQGSDVLLNANTASNGARATTLDTEASNGVIHTIDRVLTSLPTTNILNRFGMAVDYSVAPPTVSGGTESGFDFTTTDWDVFAYAIRKSNLAFTIIPNSPILPEWTIFAPTDGVFVPYLTTQSATVIDEKTAIAYLKGKSEAEVADIVKYHMLSGRYLSTDFSAGQTIPSFLTGKSIGVMITGPDIFITDLNAAADPKITTANTFFSNGVTHTINGVLRSN